MNDNLRYIIKHHRVRESLNKALNDEYFNSRDVTEIISKLKLAESSEKLEFSYPIIFPSCNNRKPSIIKDLKHISSPVYIFVYASQEKLYEYIKQENVTKVIVPDEFVTIQRMRKYMQEFMGDKIYWMLDDDIVEARILANKVSIKWYEGLYVLDKILAERGVMNSTCIGGPAIEMSNYFYASGGETKIFKFTKCGYIVNVFIINGKLCKEKKILFKGDPNVSEDLEITIDARERSGKILQLMGVTFVCDIGCLNKAKKSIASTPVKVKKYTICNYKKFGQWIKFKFKKDQVFPITVLRKTPKAKDPMIEHYLDIQDWMSLKSYIERKK